MEGKALGEFIAAQFRAGNVRKGRVIKMRERYTLVIDLREQPAGVALHHSPVQNRAHVLAGAMRKTRVLSYSKWERAGWTVKDIAEAHKILRDAGEIAGKPAGWVK